MGNPPRKVLNMKPLGGSAGPAAPANPITDIEAYPVLTEQINAGAVPTAAPQTSSSGGLPLTQTVDDALRNVLGWRAKPGDVKGFMAALNQSFDLTNFEGHVEAKWTPRSYAAMVQDDMGAVTGAQASIYTRAKVALDQSLPLLDGLYPLGVNVPLEDIESIKSIVRAEVIELVSELGIVGGPRVQRVDELFRLLIGVGPGQTPQSSAEDLRKGCQMEELRNRLEMYRDQVNTIEDEQNYTNFLVLVDYINSLKISWDGYRPFFTRRSAEPFLGTQLVLMARSLTAVGEAVQDVYFTMDSVFLGPGERQTMELQFAGGTVKVLAVPADPNSGSTRPGQLYSFPFPTTAAPLFVSELMEWVGRVASDEGPRLIQNSGKDGVIALFPMLDQLRKLTRGALVTLANGVQDPNALPAGYSTSRVQRMIEGLADALDEATRLAGEITVKEQKPRQDILGQALLEDAGFISALKKLI